MQIMACGNIGDFHKGQELHGEMERLGILKERTKNRYVGSALVDMYSRCGFIEKARNIFDMYPVQDVVAWNTLISRYVDYGFDKEALLCFKQMQLEGISPNVATFVGILKSCINLDAIDLGKEICRDIEKLGFLDRSPSVGIGNAITHVYAKFGLVDLAQEIFNKLQDRDLVSWNTLISGYVEQACSKEAFKCVKEMQASGLSPDAITFVALVKVCASVRDIEKGKEIHSEIERRGLSSQNVTIGNALVDMYARCGYVTMAENIFHRVSDPDTYTWNALMTGYSEYGFASQAIKCFESMQLHDVHLDVVTFICCLKACSSIPAMSKGREMHSEIERLGYLETDPEVGNVLIDMYVKCGLLEKAQEVFDRLPDRSIVSWTSLITGYIEHELAEEAIECFEQMQLDGIAPDAMTFLAGLKACGSMGAINKGEEMHIEIERRGLLEQDIVCGKALVDMYAKCSCLDKAQQVFSRLPIRDVVAWTTLMAGYAQLGESVNVFCVYNKMLEDGVKPDEVVFAITLGACGQLGLLQKHETYFEVMSKGIVSIHKLFTCIVHFFSSIGQLDNAFEMIKKMPCCPTPKMWNNLLGASRYSGNLVVGRHAFEHAT